MLEVGVREEERRTGGRGGVGRRRHAGNVGQGWTIHFAPIHTLLILTPPPFLLKLSLSGQGENQLGQCEVQVGIIAFDV